MNAHLELQRLQAETRRTFLTRSGVGLGAIALQSLLHHGAQASALPVGGANPLAIKEPPIPAKARAVIYLHMSGAPPTLDLFDYKPKLNELNMQDCPESLIKGKRFAFIKGLPKMLGHPHKFQQAGGNGLPVCELMPNFMQIVDEVAVIRSMTTDQFNHAPAELFVHTGNMRAGSAAIGSWATYGLGSENADLPGFVVLLSGGTDPTGGKSLWSSGFLPSVYQGVQCRTTGEPILFSSNPEGMSRDSRRRTLDALAKLNQLEAQQFGDPETVTRIAQYELAYRMQAAVPEAFDITREPKHILDMYGAKPGEGSFANNCLLARRLVENGVRYIQLFDWGWDIHGTGKGDDLVNKFPEKCKDVDQACAALVKDLKQRGMLESTLVVWGGEFGRTPMNEARGGSKFLGRDHHPNCFGMWMAGGGVKGGVVHGATDELGYDVVEGKVTIRDLQTTILHQLGFDAKRLSYRYQGLNQRLIGPADEGRVVREVLA
ncbi:uncharacterized protein DUF1501 [Roseimicrobium gellanilyticum]|uniref:Uncharacterized protein DUF1501 n=1 Tax=Roseimicrobium gellanilyticum TaxID=748857 RepID=A0A366H1T9_9BACT|nr:DUF1501 domain-containing protein [Roseimicrobium gellanilyticum]RBP35209.1 uncharacterized protein DUF1501 [Roseimicrobium gellanilyticum]